MESSGDGSHATVLMSLNWVPKAAGQSPDSSSEDAGKSASLRGLRGRGRLYSHVGAGRGEDAGGSLARL